jgi:uridine kinase
VNRRLLIGIAGPSGSGKTSVAQNLHGILGSEQVLILAEDNYYGISATCPGPRRA